jgi:hypothetical protein
MSIIPWMLFKPESKNVWYMFNGEWVNCCYVRSPETYSNNHWTKTMYGTELPKQEIEELRKAAVKGEGTSFVIREVTYVIVAAGEFNSRSTEEEIIFRNFRPEGVAGDVNSESETCMFYRSYLTGPGGAHYELLREGKHTEEDVIKAKVYIRKNFDPVSIKVIKERELLKGEQ